MSVLLDWIVPIASTVTATGAIATAGYARRIVSEVGDNKDRSLRNRELLTGDPEALDGPVIDRLREVEEQVET
ncbi:hypothetical protein [Halapricum hydrolyticum]|uniref:Uncharacterized protein n=1 Tax=Halapricum hydrolyticum TaxID=2979991 RepID=A0AAE3LDU6_9EURY|nr:hypothetical protein [Halapricum hydrolyticum]MCU4716858.1 hypothetical protein [Halapricum hydrolyticum]MCU4725537.1 hypothetical protein [Halapricum hydrolyticum]